jgi:integrase
MRPVAREWTADRVTAFWIRFDEAAAGLTLTRQKVDLWASLPMRPYPVMLWTPAQTGAFLDQVAGDRLYAMWLVFAFGGLRRGEVAGPRWPDIDLDAGVLRVETERIQLGWEVAEDEPKSEASAAPLPLDEATVAALRAWRKAQMREQLAAGPAWVSSGRVFTREDGRALHPALITHWFRHAAFAAHLPPVRLHDLRRGTGSLMHAAGADMKAISTRLRHATTAITADVYTTVFAERAGTLAADITRLVPRAAASGTAGPTSVPQDGPEPV